MAINAWKICQTFLYDIANDDETRPLLLDLKKPLNGRKSMCEKKTRDQLEVTISGNAWVGCESTVGY